MTASGFYHCSVKSVGRGNGRSVVAAAAYRAGERLADDRTGEVFDYRARSGVDETFVLARDGASTARAQDIGRLWNDAELAEPRANGRLATEIVVGIPQEFDAKGRRELADQFARQVVEQYGVAAQVSIHAPDKDGDQRNWHAHILFTHREFSADGFGDVSNPRAVMKKNKKGLFKEAMIYGIAANPADVIALRKEWEQTVNRAYERAGLDIRVDHRSHEERGIEQEPTKHLGPTATDMERRGAESERGAANREITQRNAMRMLEAEARDLGAQIIDVKADLAMQAAHAGARGRYDDLRDTQRQVSREEFPGRYDDLRAAEPPPEVVRAFESNANRTAEPAAPVYDRDADNAAWEAKLSDAAIAAEKNQRQPGTEAGRAGGPDPREATADLWAELRAWNTEARADRDDAFAGDRALHSTVNAGERGVEDTLHAADGAVNAGLDAASGALSGLAKAVEQVLGGIFSFFGGGGEPKLSPMQAELAARANEELAGARAQIAALQENEAAHDWQTFEQIRQQQQEELERAMGYRERPGDRERERERERDRY